MPRSSDKNFKLRHYHLRVFPLCGLLGLRTDRELLVRKWRPCRPSEGFHR